MRELRAERLGEEDSVGQAHVIRAPYDNLEYLPHRGSCCPTGRSEMASELWQTLHGRLGQENVETFVEEER